MPDIVKGMQALFKVQCGPLSSWMAQNLDHSRVHTFKNSRDMLDNDYIS